MGILSRATIIAALFTGASALHAFEQRTIWFNVPYNVTYPQTTAPTFPPTFAPTQGGDWSTYSDIGSAGIMGIPTGGDAGLLIPNVGQLFGDLLVPGSLQGDLLSASITVNHYMFGEWKLTLISPAEAPQLATASANGDMIIYALQSPTIDFGDIAPLFGPVLSSENLAISTVGGVSNSAPQVTLTAFTNVTKVIDFGGDDLIILTNRTPSFATLPIDSFTQGTNVTTGNYSTEGATFAAVRVGITYTFLPESEWVWAGFPLVMAAWVIRRQLSGSSRE